VAKTRLYVSTAGIALGISAIIVGAVLYSVEKSNWKYGIVADGGSSHTSFVLFNWPESHLGGIYQISDCSAKGGGIDQV